MPIVATGSMPATILENGRAGDWSALLSLSGAAGATDVALTGEDAALFEASLGPGGQVTIAPVGALDREAFPAGADPLLDFGLSVRLDGVWQAVPGGWSIALLGLDDTAPSDLRFRNGGTVLENDIAAPIGDLLASDPDSDAANLEYRVLWPDSAFFEIVGTTLKLRDGVDLLRLGGTTREVMIAVSDGLNEAAFSLGVTVLNVTSEDDAVTPAPTPSTPTGGGTGGTGGTGTGSNSGTPTSIPTTGTGTTPSTTTPGTTTPGTTTGGTTGTAPTGTTGSTSPPGLPAGSTAANEAATTTVAADVIITSTGATTDVAEGGATDTFTVQLSRQPTATVTVAITVGADLNLARSTTANPGKTVSFAIAAADWARARSVIVSAANDSTYEGTENAWVQITTSSSDAAFSNLQGRGVNVTVYDNDPSPSPPPPPPPPPPGTPAGLALVQTSAATAVAERGAGDSFTIALACVFQ
ncbi:hypothetical protein SAMN02745194_04175 [Roseomonas rosea]|uniref:Calx-beta domain-containing protein n=1 Tax=Muricoccus roseus TaxID=198092 RepID=A0A1M6PPN3_9PROT|nr:hypothetical protein [Roseomonas rosea]SHK09879.1 hypothetical protein SAMN02745194_04175 [Roseomonas rosea]